MPDDLNATPAAGDDATTAGAAPMGGSDDAQKSDDTGAAPVTPAPSTDVPMGEEDAEKKPEENVDAPVEEDKPVEPAA